MDFLLRVPLVTIWLLTVTGVALGKDDNCIFTYEDGSIVTDMEWNLNIDLTKKNVVLLDTTKPNTIFYSFGVKNLVAAKSAEDSSSDKFDKFFTAEFDQAINKLHLKTSKEFSKIEEVLEHQTFRFSIQVNCTRGSKTITLTLKLKDTNNKPPTFENKTYYYKAVPMPLGTNLKVFPLLYQITITDLDPTSKGIVDISLKDKGNEYFSGSTTRINGGKEYALTLTTIKKLELVENLTFEITATDHGTADDLVPMNSSATITLEPDVVDSVYEPTFIQPLYTADIKEAEKGVIKFSEGQIELKGLGKGNIIFNLTDALGEFDYSSYINCVSDPTKQEIVVCSWNEGKDSTKLLQKPYGLLKLMAKQEDYVEDYTIIHLTLPGPPTPTTTTSTTVTETTPQPCPTTTQTETTTECPVCPTTSTVTECDCSSTSVTFDPTTMCPTSTTLSTGHTEGTSCPTFDPTTMCPTSTDSGSSTTLSTGHTEGTSCPTFDPTTMCPTSSTGGSTCITECPECPTVCPTTETTGNGTSSTTTPIDSTTQSSPSSETSSSSTTTNATKPTSTSQSTSETSTTCECICPSSSTEILSTTTPSDPSSSTDSGTTASKNTSTSDKTSTHSGGSTSSTSTNTDTTTMSSYPTASGSSTHESTTCPVCPTTCPDCSTTWSSTSSTSSPEPIKPEFEQRKYHVMIDSPVKNIMILQPHLKNKVDKVLFTLQADNVIAKQIVEISNSTGEITLTTYPPGGTYTYQLQASVPGTDLSDSVPLTVEVISGQICYNDSYVFQTLYLAIKVPENHEYTLPGLVYLQDIDCNFTLSANIDSLNEHFLLNPMTGEVTVKDLDREATEFNKTAEPSIRLTLVANCGDQDKEENKWSASSFRDDQRGSDEAEIVESIPNLNSSMIIVVIVEDVNDHPPVFNPNTLTVGYPTRELSSVLQPPSLANVQASDGDIGENAVIIYSLNDEEDGEHFWIHPTTGVIYPRKGEFIDGDDVKKLKVSARNTDGLTGSQSTLSIDVWPLKKDNVFEMTVSGAVLENIHSLLENISMVSGLKVRELTSAVVSDAPSPNSGSRRSALMEEESPTALRLVLYALEGNKPAELKTVKERLNAADWQVREIETNGGGSDAEDTSGLEAAVITLAVFLVLIIGGGGAAAYYFVIRPRMNKTTDYKSFSRDSKEGTDSDLSSVVPTIPPLTDDILKKSDNVEVSNSPDVLNKSLNNQLYENVPDNTDAGWSSPAVNFERPTTSDWESSEVTPPQKEVEPESQPDYLLGPPDVPQPRKRSLTLYGEGDLLDAREQLDETSDDYEPADGEDTADKAARRKSVVTFNENVDTIEIDRL